MGHFVQKSCKLWLDGFDFSGDINAIAINYDADEVEDTHFGDSTHIFLGGGLLKFDAQFEGGINLGTATVEGTNFSNVGTADTPVTIGLDTGADGEIGYTMKSLTRSFSWGEKIGALQKYSVSLSASNERLVRGTIMHNATRTATANGTARQLGAVAAGKSVYATLHVLATVSGTNPTLDVVVASAATDSWPGTIRRTFTTATAIGSEVLAPLAGSITDIWWRVQYTIAGNDTPTFPFVVIIGIV